MKIKLAAIAAGLAMSVVPVTGQAFFGGDSWEVCFDLKVVGVDVRGDKVKCRKCELKRIWISPSHDGLVCQTFQTKDDAKSYMRIMCDCP